MSAPFGTLPDGTPVELLPLRGDGIEAAVLTYGATLQRLRVPDRDGRIDDVVLGFPTLDGYLAHPEHFLGETVGRYANRIAGGRFVLDGVEYRLQQNDGASTLHGGATGFGERVWRAERVSQSEVVLRYTSPDGEMGFPGTLEVEARFSLVATTLRVDYRAETDAATVVNLACHAYWNLAGAGAVEEHLLTVAASRYTPVDEALIPTGEIATVEDTPFDFRRPVRLGARMRQPHPQLLRAQGYDHNFVLDGAPVCARLEDPRTGRVLEVATTEPGLQVYTGNFLDGTFAGIGGVYRQGDGIALETQHFPDSPNQPQFPSTVLRPGDVYRSTTEYRLSSPA